MELNIGDKMYSSFYGELELVCIAGKTLVDTELLRLGFSPPNGLYYYLFKGKNATNAICGIYSTKEGKFNPNDKMRSFFTRTEAKILGMKLPPRTVKMYQAIVTTKNGTTLTNTLYSDRNAAEKEHGDNLIGLSNTAITYEVEEEL